MKKFYFLALSALLLCSACGPDKKLMQAQFENSNYAKVRIEGSDKYGVKDVTTGQEILPQNYEAIDYYATGYFMVRDSSGVQLFDESGANIIPAQEQINAKTGHFEFSNEKVKGLYFINSNFTISGEYDKLCVDAAGNVLFTKDGLSGIMNTKGETLIPGEYKLLIWDGKNYNAAKDKDTKKPYFDEKTQTFNWSRAEASTFDKGGKRLKKLSAAQAKKIFEVKK